MKIIHYILIFLHYAFCSSPIYDHRCIDELPALGEEPVLDENARSLFLRSIISFASLQKGNKQDMVYAIKNRSYKQWARDLEVEKRAGGENMRNILALKNTFRDYLDSFIYQAFSLQSYEYIANLATFIHSNSQLSVLPLIVEIYLIFITDFEVVAKTLNSQVFLHYLKGNERANYCLNELQTKFPPFAIQLSLPCEGLKEIITNFIEEKKIIDLLDPVILKEYLDIVKNLIHLTREGGYDFEDLAPFLSRFSDLLSGYILITNIMTFYSEHNWNGLTYYLQVRCRCNDFLSDEKVRGFSYQAKLTQYLTSEIASVKRYYGKTLGQVFNKAREFTTFWENLKIPAYLPEASAIERNFWLKQSHKESLPKIIKKSPKNLQKRKDLKNRNGNGELKSRRKFKLKEDDSHETEVSDSLEKISTDHLVGKIETSNFADDSLLPTEDMRKLEDLPMTQGTKETDDPIFGNEGDEDFKSMSLFSSSMASEQAHSNTLEETLPEIVDDNLVAEQEFHEIINAETSTYMAQFNEYCTKSRDAKITQKSRKNAKEKIVAHQNDSMDTPISTAQQPVEKEATITRIQDPERWRQLSRRSLICLFTVFFLLRGKPEFEAVMVLMTDLGATIIGNFTGSIFILRLPDGHRRRIDSNHGLPLNDNHKKAIARIISRHFDLNFPPKKYETLQSVFKERLQLQRAKK